MQKNNRKGDVIVQLSLREQILLRPDSYVGSVEKTEQEWYLFDDTSGKMYLKTIHIVEGFVKIFDEILVNASDNKQRDENTSSLDVVVNTELNSIQVFNDGMVLPIRIHSTLKKLIPQIAFGELLTSENYDDSKKRTTGGKNGLGATLCNVYSKEFTVTIVEHLENQEVKQYVQTWKNNMSEQSEAEIKTFKGKKKKTQGTTVYFKPDLAKFNMQNLDSDTVAVLRRRVMDMAATTGLKVTFNGQKLKTMNNFKDYVKHYVPNEHKLHVFESPRWQIALCPANSGFQHVTFVNNIFTARGGTHIKYVMNPFEKFLINEIDRRRNGINAKNLTSKNIREHCMLFVNCLIENPSFDTQTKTFLTLNSSKFGSTVELDEASMKKMANSGILELVENAILKKTAKSLTKFDGQKKNNIFGIPKLTDANWAGTKNSEQCTLILTEGDSAKALAVAGLSVVGKDTYGVFPLKGKVINPSKNKLKEVLQNKEVRDLIRILGLKVGHIYTSVKELRYGHVMLMTDQDSDGTHIKALVIYLFAHLWPSLLSIPGFLQQFITPLVRITKQDNTKKSIDFFSESKYQEWLKSTSVSESKKWKVKYFKGLGTSTAKDARDYFSNLERHCLTFDILEEKGWARLKMALDTNADLRKVWLNEYVKTGKVSNPKWEGLISYEDFVNDELIVFAWDSVTRAIPSIYDGLKPGQRKILFSLLNISDIERKVSQLMGIVSDKSHYHHGEVSLGKTIIRMAQVLVGKNNLNLLVPNGQFGTKEKNGLNSADPRYLFTELSPITKTIINKEDDVLLTKNVEDGFECEYTHFLPTIPLVLVNGAKGIAMGWATNVPQHDPKQLLKACRDMLKGKKCPQLDVFYRGFKGDVSFVQGKIVISGIINKQEGMDNVLVITELPVHVSTFSYKIQLEKMIENNILSSIIENHTEHSILFRIVVKDLSVMQLETLELLKFFKLTSESTPNLVLFDTKGELKTYSNTQEIFSEFFYERLKQYELRRLAIIDGLEKDIVSKQNLCRFIEYVINNKIVIQNVDSEILVKQMESLQFIDIRNLLCKSIMSLTKDKYNVLKNDCLRTSQLLTDVSQTTAKELWYKDLDKFEKSLNQWEQNYNKEILDDKQCGKKNKPDKKITHNKRKRVYKTEKSINKKVKLEKY